MFGKINGRLKIILPPDKAMVHWSGSTVNKRPSYRIPAFDTSEIFEPSSRDSSLMVAVSPLLPRTDDVYRYFSYTKQKCRTQITNGERRTASAERNDVVQAHQLHVTKKIIDVSKIVSDLRTHDACSVFQFKNKHSKHGCDCERYVVLRVFIDRRNKECRLHFNNYH